MIAVEEFAIDKEHRRKRKKKRQRIVKNRDCNQYNYRILDLPSVIVGVILLLLLQIPSILLAFLVCHNIG